MPTKTRVEEARVRLVAFVADRGDTIGKTLNEHLAALESAIREEERGKHSGFADADWRRQMESYGFDSVAKVLDRIAAERVLLSSARAKGASEIRAERVKVLEEVERRAVQMRDADHGNEVPADYYYGAALGEMLSEARGKEGK